MKSILLPTMAVLLAIGTVNAFAQTNENQGVTTPNNQGQLSSTDYRFAKDAMRGGAMEVALGQVAAENGQDPSVRSFGNKMVQDHQAANQKLAQVISQKGATVSDTTSWLDKREINHLQGLKGAEFDAAYMKRTVKDHQETIKLFEKQIASGDDADIKSFASKTLPTLQEHLRMALDTQAKLGTSASN